MILGVCGFRVATEKLRENPLTWKDPLGSPGREFHGDPNAEMGFLKHSRRTAADR